MKRRNVLRKVTSALTALLLILCLCVSTDMDVSAAELKDSYEKGNVLYQYNAATASSDWTIFSRGKWTFGADGISLENNDGRTGDDAWYYAYTGAGKGWKDYVIECDMSGVTECGMFFRLTNPTDATVDSFGGYYCGYDSSYIFMGHDNNDAWKTITTGGPDASAQYNSMYTPNMHWTIYVIGNTFTLYVDGAKFATVQCVDDNNLFTTGGIGVRFRTYQSDGVSEYSGKIQNIKVTELKKASSSTTGSQGTTGNTGTINNNQSTDNNATANNQTTDPNAENQTVVDENTTGETTEGDVTQSEEEIIEEVVTEEVVVKTEIPKALWIALGVVGFCVPASLVTLLVVVLKGRKGGHQ